MSLTKNNSWLMRWWRSVRHEVLLAWRSILSRSLTHAFPLALLTALIVSLAFTNVRLGTWLTGWDNLHPEFNFVVNIERSLSAAWQEYQGVGLLGGMSHAADLTRQIILWLTSFLIPTQYLRYSWVFAMLWLGAVGSYVCLLSLLARSFDKPYRWLQLPALVGALFYLLNLATVQSVYTPFETFVSFYGFFPWLLWAFTRYLTYPQRSHLRALFILSVLASSAFYVQTMFVVWMMVSGVFTFFFLCHHQWRRRFQAALTAYLIIFAASAFWLLPALYFTLTSSAVTLNAKINHLSTSEVQLMNYAFGSFDNIALLKGYWFEYLDFKPGVGHTYLLQPWREHLENPLIVFIGYGLFGLAGLGFISLLFQRRKLAAAGLGMGLLALVMMSSGNGVMGIIFQGLSDVVPLFGQMFRTSFTKWSVVTAFVIGWGLALVMQQISHTVQSIRLLPHTIAATLVMGMMLMYTPAWQGHLLYSGMTQQIPEAYFELFDYFRAQPHQNRIALLPAYSFWGWSYYDWGYRGSGFPWYGIEQPILDRAFDVWSPYNETFYLHLQTAITQRSPEHLAQVLDQFDVNFVIFDASVQPTSTPTDAGLSTLQQQQELMAKLGWTREWSKHPLTVWRRPQATSTFIKTATELPIIANESLFGTINQSFMAQGPYLQATPQLPAQSWYPFAALTRERLPHLTKLDDETLEIRADLGASQKSQPTTRYLALPKLNPGETYHTSFWLTRNSDQVKLMFPEITLMADGVAHRLAGPDDVAFSLPSGIEQVIIELNGTQYQVNQNQTVIGSLTAIVGDDIPIDYFDAARIRSTTTSQQISTQDITRVILPATELWQGVQSSSSLQLTVTHWLTLQVRTPKISVPLGQAILSNCDPLKRGKIFGTTSPPSYTYEAHGYAIACEGAILPGTSSTQDYVLEIDSATTAGRRLTFFAYDSQNQTTTLIEEDYNDLAASWFGLQGLTLDVTNSSAGRWALSWETKALGVPTHTNVTAINVYPVPLTQLSQLSLTTAATTDFTEFAAPPAESTSVTPLANTQFGTAVYTASVDTDQPTALILSQGYDQGWSLWNTSDGLPQRLSVPQTTFSGWANAWVLPPGSYDLVIVYWPQFLSWLGFGLLAAVGGFLLTPRRSHFHFPTRTRAQLLGQM